MIAAVTAHFIPPGRIKKLRPNFAAKAAVLANERDFLRQVDPCDPHIRDSKLKIRQLVDQHVRTK